MNHSIRTSLRVAAFAMFVGSAAAATIEIQGNVTQTAELKNSPTTGLAIGPMARAEAGVNRVEGSVKLGGNLTQSANLSNSPTTALAIGPGATATARVNAIVGK